MAYVKHGLVDDAIEVLGLKKWKDKMFEVSLYHLLICTCKELGHLSNSLKISASMPQHDKTNLHITCTMIDVHISLLKLVVYGRAMRRGQPNFNNCK